MHAAIDERSTLTVIELCAGAGGQALGISTAGFSALALVETNRTACQTLRINRPDWPVWHGDLRTFDATRFAGKNVTLVAGGVPCQPFTIAGQQRGHDDERDLFGEAIRVVGQCMPLAILFENVPALASPRFSEYRGWIMDSFRMMGYCVEAHILNAAAFSVPQYRRRYVIVGCRSGNSPFPWPSENVATVTVGDALRDLMAANGWRGADRWAGQADRLAPTIVGGSERHGGPDLGPTRTRQIWSSIRVDARGIGDSSPPVDFPEDGYPRLTVRMAARLQGFPDSWRFAGSKTRAYKQVGNAFPPPVANALARAILTWLKLPEEGSRSSRSNSTSLEPIRSLELARSCGTVRA